MLPTVLRLPPIARLGLIVSKLGSSWCTINNIGIIIAKHYSVLSSLLPKYNSMVAVSSINHYVVNLLIHCPLLNVISTIAYSGYQGPCFQASIVLDITYIILVREYIYFFDTLLCLLYEETTIKSRVHSFIF
jgi:hypothetical protein